MFYCVDIRLRFFFFLRDEERQAGRQRPRWKLTETEKEGEMNIETDIM